MVYIGLMTETFKKLTCKAQRRILSAPRCFALAPLGLTPVTQIAIDDDWSALRYKQSPA